MGFQWGTNSLPQSDGENVTALSGTQDGRRDSRVIDDDDMEEIPVNLGASVPDDEVFKIEMEDPSA